MEKDIRKYIAKTESFISKTKEKISRDENISKELRILKDIDMFFTKTKVASDSFKNLLDSSLSEFEKYQAEYEQLWKKKREEKLKRSKVKVYKALWNKKNIFYKLTHPSQNPKKIYFEYLDNDNLDEKLNQLDRKK